MAIPFVRAETAVLHQPGEAEAVCQSRVPGLDPTPNRNTLEIRKRESDLEADVPQALYCFC
jgi:hypothetical protein